MRPNNTRSIESLKQDYQALHAPPTIIQQTQKALQSQAPRRLWSHYALPLTALAVLVLVVGLNLTLQPVSSARFSIPNIGSPVLSWPNQKPRVVIRSLSAIDALPLLPPSPKSPVNEPNDSAERPIFTPQNPQLV